MSAETKNFIAGKWVATGSTFGSVNPATGELVSRCAEASQQELDAAVAAACDAFPAWRKTPPRRAEISESPNSSKRAKTISRDGSRWRWAKSRWKRAATCRKRSTWHATWPAKTAHVWSHRAERAARQILHELARSDRRRRCHHAVEFPDCCAELENSARVRARQHGRVEAVKRHARVRGEVRGSLC